jgi:hypothetical protein
MSIQTHCSAIRHLPFEVSEAGIAFGKTATPGEVPAAGGAISVSPLRQRAEPEVLAREVAALASNRRHRAALILPDYCARTAVLDFDAFPSRTKTSSGRWCAFA